MLSSKSEPFLWFVRESGTTLILLGITSFCQKYDKEQNRFDYFREGLSPDEILISFYENREDAKCFYWDGYDFREISITEARTVYDNVMDGVGDFLRTKYAYEAAICKDELEIQFVSCVVKKKFEKSIAYAKSLGDTSLERCLWCLSKYSRKAVDHYIEISKDFTEHGYLFSEKINHVVVLNGGIIMNPNATKDRWGINT